MTSARGTADSRSAQVLLVAPPVITSQPNATTLESGSAAVLRSAANGTALNWQWYRGASGDTSHPVPGATGPLLVTRPLDSSATYWARVSNGAGHTDTTSAAVSIIPPLPARMRLSGANSQGQLGDGGATTSRSTPWIFGADIAKMAAGESHSLFVKTDGTLWAMGSNSYGQLGDGTTTFRPTPVQVAADVRLISAGNRHSLFVKSDGTLWAMGYNNSGKLGDGTTTSRPTPVQSATDVREIAAGSYHSLFLKSDGSLWATGSNGSGRFGNGNSISQSTPIKIADGIVAAATADSHSMFLSADGTLRAVGYNASGQLGDGTTTSRISPVVVATGVIGIAAGGNQSFALKEDRSLWATGENASGQLGNGATTGLNTYQQVGTAVISMAVGSSHSMIRDLVPVIVAGPDDTSAPAGGTPVLTVLAGGVGPFSYQWYLGEAGDITSPQTGGDAASFTIPPLAETSSYWVRVSNSHGHADTPAATVTLVTPPQITTQSGAATASGEIGALLEISATGGVLSYQWFRGYPGDTSQPVPGGTSSQLLTPPLDTDATFWARVRNAAGSIDSAVYQVMIRPGESGRLLAAGRNSNGQLGDGTTSNRPTPVFIAGSIRSLAAGGSHSLLVKTDGSLWATGSNSSGQIGDGVGGSFDRTSPVWVADGVALAAAGAIHGLFVKNDNTLWAMGSNGSGRLGDGTTTSRSSPVQVADSVRVASAGDSHSLFLKTDGSLWAMGLNNSGQFGDGSTTNRSMPVQIAADVMAIAAGGSHSLFVKTDGTLWAMGSNDSGRLGHGTTASRNSPVQFASNVLAASAGGSHSLFCDSVPVIESQPADVGVVSGTTAALGIIATGPGILTFQWYLGTSGDTSSPIAGETEMDLETGSVMEDMEFWVRATNASGSADSRTVTVRVVTQPVVTGLTESPENGMLTVAATGGMLSYQWFEGLSGDVSAAVDGATGPVFLSRPITSPTAFWVRVTNAAGQADSETVDLTETPPLSARLLATGSNSSGQFGNGTNVSRNLPLPIASRVTTMAAGTSHTLFVTDDGVLRGMGLNSNSQLGIGSDGGNRFFPEVIDSNVTAIAAGDAHSLYLKADGGLWAMGSNSSGQLGDGTTVNRDRPIHVADGVVSATAGSHSLFFKSDGTLWATGSNSSGQLGDGTTSTRSTPVQVATSVAGISASGDFSLVLDLRPTIRTEPADIGIAGGNPVVFTSEADGPGPFSWQWYAGPAGDTSAPVTGATSATFTTPAVTAAATYWARVANDHGTADTRAATVAPVTFPVIVSQPVAQTITLGGTGALSVSTTGGMASYQWYEGSAGDISNPVPGANSNVLVTPPLISASSYWVRVSNASGSADSAAAVISVAPPVPANLRAAGSAAYGQLGTGTMTAWIHPAPVGDDIAEVAVSPGHVLFLKTDGTLWAAGANQHGQLGDGTTIGRSRPVMIASEVSSIAVSSHRSLFVKTDGTLWLMGASYGPNPTQILTGVTRAWLSASHLYHLDATLTLRQRIAGGGSSSIFATGVASFSSGSSHSLFVKTDKTLWGFGNNSNGQLGDNRLPVSSPVKLADDVATAAAGDKHSLFLKTDGTLWGMGSNEFGQLGLPIVSSWPTPQVMIANDVVDLSAGFSHSLFIKADGSLWSMGSNSSGQLGDGTTNSRNSPVQVAGDVTAIHAGASHSQFLKTDDSLWSMGGNANGRLGDDTTTNRPTPVQVDAGVFAASAGGSHSLWLTSNRAIPVTTIAGHPPSAWIEPGSAASLIVDARGEALSYQWYRGLPGDLENPLPDATAATFTTTAEGSFWVRATGANGSANSRAAQVTFIVPPEITTQPALVAREPGGGFTLAAIASNAWSYQWFAGLAGDESQPLAGATGATLLTRPVTATNPFWVRATNPAGSADSLSITVEPPAAAGRFLFAAGQRFGSSNPVLLSGAVTTAASGGNHGLFVTTDGTLWAVGQNTFGQLGTGNTVTAATPVRVADDVTAVAAGNDHSLFIRKDGSLWAMGRNINGQLGIASNSAQSLPVPVTDGVVAIAAGSSHSLFIRSDGSLSGMGRNLDSELLIGGNASPFSRSEFFFLQRPGPDGQRCRHRGSGFQPQPVRQARRHDVGHRPQYQPATDRPGKPDYLNAGRSASQRPRRIRRRQQHILPRHRRRWRPARHSPSSAIRFPRSRRKRQPDRFCRRQRPAHLSMVQGQAGRYFLTACRIDLPILVRHVLLPGGRGLGARIKCRRLCGQPRRHRHHRTHHGRLSRMGRRPGSRRSRARSGRRSRPRRPAQRARIRARHPPAGTRCRAAAGHSDACARRSGNHPAPACRLRVDRHLAIRRNPRQLAKRRTRIRGGIVEVRRPAGRNHRHATRRRRTRQSHRVRPGHRSARAHRRGPTTIWQPQFRGRTIGLHPHPPPPQTRPARHHLPMVRRPRDMA